MKARRPNEGNPRVRIDEERGASALPRRGHLFDGGVSSRHVAAFLSVAFAAALPALAETWTFQSTSISDGNYSAANAWRDNAGGTDATLDASSTTPRTYIVPAGKKLCSPSNSARWSFTSCEDDVFILQGSSSSFAEMQTKVGNLYVPLLRMQNNSRLVMTEKDYAAVCGKISVEASEDYPAQISLRNWLNRYATNTAEIVGSGALVYNHLQNTWNQNALLLKCDASGFTGPLAMQLALTIHPSHSNEYARLGFAVSESANIGGNPATFMQNGLELAGIRLIVMGDVGLGANRGLYIASNYTNKNIAAGSEIAIKSGCIFTVPSSVAFESPDYPLILTSTTMVGGCGGGTLALVGWAKDGTVSVSAGTLDITGARVRNGMVTAATIGTLTRSAGTITVTLSGDGSQLADGEYTILEAAANLPSTVTASSVTVSPGAFTVSSGSEYSFKIVGGTKIVMVVGNPWWEFTNTSTGDSADGNFMTANVWKDSSGATHTFDTNSTTARDYIIPGGKSLWTPHVVAYSSWWKSFTQSEYDRFILRGSSSSPSILYVGVSDMTVSTLLMEDNSIVWFRHQNKDNARPAEFMQILRGNMIVNASEQYPAEMCSAGYFGRYQTNATVMAGSGAIRYVEGNIGSSQQGGLYLMGDASRFTGPIEVSNYREPTTIRCRVDFSSIDNLGGDPTEYLEKGLALRGAELNVRSDVTLTPNRGVYVISNETMYSQINVDSGKTFTIPGRIKFEEGALPLYKLQPGGLKVGGWSTNGTVAVSAGMLEITGASVSNGTLTPAKIGSLAMSGSSTVTLTVTGDGSPITPAMGASFDLIDCGGTLPSDWDSRLTVVNDGAFAFAPGTKASYSVEDGKIKMSVVEYVPEWTLNTNNGVYTNANVWTDEAGVRQTWTAAAAATKMEYFVPVNWTLKTPGGSGAEDVDEISKLFVFSSNPDSVLTVRSGGLFQSNVMYVHVPNIVLNDSAGVLLWIANNQSGKYRSARSITGTLHVNASESNPAFFRVMAYYGDLVRTNAMTIVGFGGFKYTRQNGSADGIVWATGDNSGFTGPVSVWDMDGKTNKAMFLHVTSSENIGGNPETYKEKGLELHSAQLCVHGNVALAPNRGFYVSSNSVVNVDSGKSFTSPNAVGFTEGTTLDKTGAGAMNVTGWANGTIAVNAGTLNISGATFASGAAGTPVSIGGIECAGGATVKLTVTGDGAALPFANATNVLVEAESALPVGFAEKVQVVNDNAFTVPAGLKTKLVVIDGAKLALETTKRKGTLLIVRQRTMSRCAGCGILAA